MLTLFIFNIIVEKLPPSMIINDEGRECKDEENIHTRLPNQSKQETNMGTCDPIEKRARCLIRMNSAKFHISLILKEKSYLLGQNAALKNIIFAKNSLFLAFLKNIALFGNPIPRLKSSSASLQGGALC